MEKKDINLLFMGTPSISADVFEALILDGYHFVGLVCQPDHPVGRKGIIEKVPTKLVAEKYNIPVFQPVKIRDDYSFMNNLKVDLVITLAYGQIVPQGFLDIPPMGCLNLHGSLLPKLRGASPIQTALIQNEKVDAAKELAIELLPLYINGELKGEEQNENEVTFCSLIKPEQEKLDLNMSLKEIYGWIRGLSDEPGAYLYLNNQKIKIFKANMANDLVTAPVGTIVQADKRALLVQLKDGQLAILELQKEGKKRMDYRSFINGNQNLLGAKFD